MASHAVRHAVIQTQSFPALEAKKKLINKKVVKIRAILTHLYD